MEKKINKDKKNIDTNKKSVISNKKKKNVTMNLKDKIINFFTNIRNVTIVVAILVVVIAIILLILLLGDDKKKDDDKVSLNEIYDVYPEEVKELYNNMVSDTCTGDLHFDLSLDTGTTSVSKMKDKNLIDYVFSYLNKNNKLTDSFKIVIVKDAAKLLFSKKIDFENKIKDYSYGNYVYNVSNGVVTRQEKKCTSNIKYVSHLYGYSSNENFLSVDINIGYLKKGKLYDLNDKLLGNYDGNVKKLGDLFGSNSYYRLNYIKSGDIYKLDSVEWNSRT